MALRTMIGVPTVVDICPPKSECLAGLATIQGNSVSIGKFEKGSSLPKRFFEAAMRKNAGISRKTQ
jgi:hypothetical protein